MPTIDLSALSQAWASVRSIADIRPIENAEDLARMTTLMNQLLDMIGDNEQHELTPVLDVVSDYIYHYEQQHYSMEDAKPAEMLVFLMEQHKITPADLPEIGTPGLVSKMMAGKQRISLKAAALLGKRFRVSPSVFIDWDQAAAA